MSAISRIIANAALALAAPAALAAQLKVVTSTTDLADIARQVGGDRVSVKAISTGYQDPHFVEAKPSFVLDLRKADCWAFVGLDLEIGWMSILLDGARNPRIRPGAPGYVDVSKAIPVIDIPVGTVDRSQGDVHPLGNPHYWLDPDNGKRIARLFAARFAELDPPGAAAYQAGLQRFESDLDRAATAWATDLASVRGKPIVAWHTSWRYLAEYTKVSIVGFVEPKPGVPPSPSHLAGLVETMKRTGAKAIVLEPFYDRKTADFLASKTGAVVLVVPPSVGGRKELTDYQRLMTNAVESLAKALK